MQCPTLDVGEVGHCHAVDHLILDPPKQVEIGRVHLHDDRRTLGFGIVDQQIDFIAAQVRGLPIFVVSGGKGVEAVKHVVVQGVEVG